jgi:hypothetical protein
LRELRVRPRDDVLRTVVGISKLLTRDPKQIEHITRITLDGLRDRARS